jgi:hypothetical protein
MWSVLSLVIAYWGSAGLAWCVYSLSSTSVVCTRMIVPLTQPASEFHVTWSPTWKAGAKSANPLPR